MLTRPRLINSPFHAPQESKSDMLRSGHSSKVTLCQHLNCLPHRTETCLVSVLVSSCHRLRRTVGPKLPSRCCLRNRRESPVEAWILVIRLLTMAAPWLLLPHGKASCRDPSPLDLPNLLNRLNSLNLPTTLPNLPNQHLYSTHPMRTAGSKMMHLSSSLVR